MTNLIPKIIAALVIIIAVNNSHKERKMDKASELLLFAIFIACIVWIVSR